MWSCLYVPPATVSLRTKTRSASSKAACSIPHTSGCWATTKRDPPKPSQLAHESIALVRFSDLCYSRARVKQRSGVSNDRPPAASEHRATALPNPPRGRREGDRRRGIHNQASDQRFDTLGCRKLGFGLPRRGRAVQVERLKRALEPLFLPSVPSEALRRLERWSTDQPMSFS